MSERAPPGILAKKLTWPVDWEQIDEQLPVELVLSSNWRAFWVAASIIFPAAEQTAGQDTEGVDEHNSNAVVFLVGWNTGITTEIFARFDSSTRAFIK